MTRLFLIRHGNTEDEETKRVYKGRIDIPLSCRGRERMTRAGAFLTAFPIEKVFVSTLSRSIESGSIIALPLGLQVEVDPAFDEVSFGLWEGLSFEEIKQRYPEEQVRWIEDPSVHPPPGGESFESAQKRSMEGLARILEAHKGRTIAVVAHAGILRIMIFSLLEMRLSRLFRIGQEYGAINIIDIWEDGNLAVNLLNFTQY